MTQTTRKGLNILKIAGLVLLVFLVLAFINLILKVLLVVGILALVVGIFYVAIKPNRKTSSKNH
jgi:uncharacterized membrane protein HdeD (DUF308 family)